MSNIKEELCYAMHKFVKEHISEMNRPASDLCIEWKNEKQMLRDIRKNFSDAVWALGELLTWGLSKDYCTELFLVCTYEDEEGYDRDICKIIDRKGRERFFKCFYPECEVVEVKQVTKMVEQTFLGGGITMSNCKVKRDININIHDAWKRYQQCSVMPMQEILSNAFASGSAFGASISCNKIIAWIKDNIEDYLDYDVSMEEVKVDEKFYEDMKMAIKVK